MEKTLVLEGLEFLFEKSLGFLFNKNSDDGFKHLSENSIRFSLIIFCLSYNSSLNFLEKIFLVGLKFIFEKSVR